MQKGITNTTNNAARTISNIGLNGAAFMINPAAYIAGLATQKIIAYGADKVSGRNEYNMGDILNNTPIMGRKYAAENPGKSTLIDFGAGMFGG